MHVGAYWLDRDLDDEDFNTEFTEDTEKREREWEKRKNNDNAETLRARRCAEKREGFGQR
jgi:hypothetical protein